MSQRPMATGPRGSRLSHLVVRLATEGVPVRAIQRAVESTDMAGSIERILERAVADRLLLTMPPLDWPEDSRVTNRKPTRLAIDANAINWLAQDLAAHLAFEPAGAKLVAALMLHGRVDSGTLTILCSPKSQNADVLKVHACRARMRLARSDIGASMTTIFGWGYWLQPPERDKVAKRLMARRKEGHLNEQTILEPSRTRSRASS